MRLIDADALLKQLAEVTQKTSEDAKYSGNRSSELTWDMAVKYIKNAPTVEQAMGKWIPLKTRPMDEDERKEWEERCGYKLVDCEAVIYMAPLPDDGQNVLICQRNGNIRMDTFVEDDCGCYFDEYGDMDGVVAWMPLPEPYLPDRNIGNISVEMEEKDNEQ